MNIMKLIGNKHEQILDDSKNSFTLYVLIALRMQRKECQ